MKTYLLTAAGAIFLSVIVSLLIPEGKLNKSIMFIMRLICIAVLIQPVTAIFKTKETSGGTLNVDYEYVSGVYTEHQSNSLEELLLKEFGCQSQCNVNVVYADGKFSVDSVEVVLPEKNSDLIDKIYEYLSKLDYINITVYAKGF